MKKHFLALDTFRGIFALIVAVFHYKYSGLIGETLLIKRGDYFVDFFFVLSGFIIYHNYKKLKTFKQQTEFIKNRIARLYPLHIIILFVFLFFEVSKYILYDYGLFKSPPFVKNNLTSFFVNLFMLQSFNISDISWNYPSWSISAELVTYFIFCIIIVRINNLSTKWRIFCLFFIVLASLYAIYKLNHNFDIRLTRNLSMFRCMYGFFTGCIAYEIFLLLTDYFDSKKKFFTVAEFFSIIMSILLLMFLPQKYTFILVISFSISILIFSFEAGALSRFLKNKTFITLGQLSYSIYMTHAIIAITFELIVSNFRVESQVYITLFLFLYLSTIILVSHYTYNSIEFKYKNIFRKKSFSNIASMINSQLVLKPNSGK
ncbi:acyltransferase family protein [Spirosoma lituiforme]